MHVAAATSTDVYVASQYGNTFIFPTSQSTEASTPVKNPIPRHSLIKGNVATNSAAAIAADHSQTYAAVGPSPKRRSTTARNPGNSGAKCVDGPVFSVLNGLPKIPRCLMLYAVASGSGNAASVRCTSYVTRY